MNLRYETLSAVPANGPTTCYKLVVRLEHGDADSTTTKELIVADGNQGEMELLSRAINFLIAYEDYDSYQMGDLVKLREVATTLKYTNDQFWELIDNIFDRDHHYSGDYARVDRWHVRYINQLGDEYFVAVHDENDVKLR